MKRKLKLTLGALALGVTAIGLTSCTASFCSVADKSQVMYAYDVYNITDANGVNTGKFSYGISTYYNSVEENPKATLVPGFTKLYAVYDVNSNIALSGKEGINANFEKQGNRHVDYTEFWTFMDNSFLEMSLNEALKNNKEFTVEKAKAEMTAEHVQTLLIGNNDKNNLKKGYGYIKYAGDENTNDYFVNWDKVYQKARTTLGADKCPGTDYVKFYKQSLTNMTAQFNSCLASKDGFFGHYGTPGNQHPVYMEEKTWSDAWSRGFFEGLLVYPIGWLIDATTNAFMGVGGGVAQVLAIIVITFLIRALMMVFTINQTAQTAKMSEIQPEVLKIQQKYPNANTNRSEQQSLAMETQALYKKYKIHPFLSILVMILQFPIFICVWGAMTGSSVLASDGFLGLRLSDSVSQTLFAGYGVDGWWTALVVFILMAAFQIVSMLLPQIIQKKKMKRLAKTGRNPAMNKQNSTMKWVSIIMMIMVIFMGFSLASGMVIYWIAGSVWTIAQTLIIELITYLKGKNKGKGPRKHKAKVASATANTVVDAEVVPEQFLAPTGKKKYKKGSKQ